MTYYTGAPSSSSPLLNIILYFINEYIELIVNYKKSGFLPPQERSTGEGMVYAKDVGSFTIMKRLVPILRWDDRYDKDEIATATSCLAMTGGWSILRQAQYDLL